MKARLSRSARTDDTERLPSASHGSANGIWAGRYVIRGSKPGSEVGYQSAPTGAISVQSLLTPIHKRATVVSANIFSGIGGSTTV